MTIEDIERAVENLDTKEFLRFQEWFSRLSETRFDRAIEEDIKAGKLDRLADETLAHARAGRTSPL